MAGKKAAAQPKAAAGQFVIRFNAFNNGAAPLAHLDSLTEIGASGQYSAAQNVDVITFPSLLTQGPGLATLTNGDQSGVVTELINFIVDKPVSSGTTYGVSTTKLHQITATAVTSSGTWPHAITSCTGGSSAFYLKGALYYVYNTSGGGDIGKYDLASTFIDAWGSVVPNGAAALQNAIHPVATKQDLSLIGNGRYLATLNITSVTLADKKLDFGQDATIADICFNANQWFIAVNQGSGVSTDRQSGSIFLYDPSATSTFLTDEIGVGVQKIGFLMPIEGIVYVAYQDLSTAGGFCIGYIKGRQIQPLRYFTGALPTFAQKTLYQNTILFLSQSVMSVGAPVEALPVQISQLASAGYTTLGAMAAPFGVPMIASTQSSSFKLAKFSGYDTNCTWRSLNIPLAQGNLLGVIDRVSVRTVALGSGARCDLKIEGNQGTKSGTIRSMSGTGKSRFVFNSLGLVALEDFRVFLNWANGSTTNPVKIREILVQGHFIPHA